MLKDRSYFVGDFEIDMSREQFKHKYGENMKREDIVINKARRNDSSDQVLSDAKGYSLVFSLLFSNRSIQVSC